MISGSIPDWSSFTALTSLYLDNSALSGAINYPPNIQNCYYNNQAGTGWTGTLPSFPSSIVNFAINGASITGTVPSIDRTNCPNLVTFGVGGRTTGITGYTAADPSHPIATTCNLVNFGLCSMPTSDVDQIISDVLDIGTSSGTLITSGPGMGAPTNPLSYVTIASGGVGSGYAVGDLIDVAGKGGPGLDLNIISVSSTGKINSVTVQNSGGGFSVGDIVYFTGGSGSGFSASIATIVSGTMTVTILAGGSGYNTGSNVLHSTNGLNGQLRVDAVNGSGAVTAISIVNGGSGYNIASPFTLTNHGAGIGTGLTLTSLQTKKQKLISNGWTVTTN